MLKKIVIENFKCFKNRTEIDFTRTNYKLLEKNTVGKMLKGALFVGDNASGKTTALQPIRLLLDLLLKDKDFFLPQFKCLFSKNPITRLEYLFDIDGHELVYQFSFKESSFLEENLSIDNKIIIKRIGENAKLNLDNEVEFHDVNSKLLFAKRVYFNTKFAGNSVAEQWFEYLKKSVYINAYIRRISSYSNIGLSANEYLEANGTDRINEFLKNNNFNYLIQYPDELQDKFQRGDEEKMIYFKRKGIEEGFPIIMESTGNQTLIQILPAIFAAVESGGMLIIDEFSSGFHNKLEELLVKYIMENGETTQLFFVSHSTNLLSNALLRPDQIYAVEFNGDEGSRCLRFSDEQPRAAQNIEKMYLSGIFGGTPEYGDFSK